MLIKLVRNLPIWPAEPTRAVEHGLRLRGVLRSRHRPPERAHLVVLERARRASGEGAELQRPDARADQALHPDAEHAEHAPYLYTLGLGVGVGVGVGAYLNPKSPG